MKKKIMILWSGGVDSTAVLKLYLQKTKHDIIAVHVNQLFQNNLNRNKFEQKAIDNISPLGAEKRPERTPLGVRHMLW